MTDDELTPERWRAYVQQLQNEMWFSSAEACAFDRRATGPSRAGVVDGEVVHPAVQQAGAGGDATDGRILVRPP